MGMLIVPAGKLTEADGLDRTAVIRHHNGSFINVAKVELDSDYKEMMQRLSLDSSKHPR